MKNLKRLIISTLSILVLIMQAGNLYAASENTILFFKPYTQNDLIVFNQKDYAVISKYVTGTSYDPNDGGTVQGWATLYAKATVEDAGGNNAKIKCTMDFKDKKGNTYTTQVLEVVVNKDEVGWPSCEKYLIETVFNPFEVMGKISENRNVFWIGIKGHSTVRVQDIQLAPEPIKQGEIKTSAVEHGKSNTATQNFVCPEYLSNIKFKMEWNSSTNANLRLKVDLGKMDGNAGKPNLYFKENDILLVSIKPDGSNMQVPVQNLKGNVSGDGSQLIITMDHVEAEVSRSYIVDIFFRCYLKNDYKYRDYVDFLRFNSESSKRHSVDVDVKDNLTGISNIPLNFNLQYVPMPKIN
ncbi:hypothetical protein CS063_16645 [Sporanaerobium hydrogeniformans]|uniref:Uncharacterized protein n=1 Tax=Sporanaerobium hydrogeniformans TaxID=3072179 RepID=A0AC61D999_9FIRM|nr:hypothetical protein [Sporanaerobium hydrogeniformans]PHV69283.1 hypothetical protein CS063_16645 [Sporanaerobium hydrogeniformans]